MDLAADRCTHRSNLANRPRLQNIRSQRTRGKGIRVRDSLGRTLARYYCLPGQSHQILKKTAFGVAPIDILSADGNVSTG